MPARINGIAWLALSVGWAVSSASGQSSHRPSLNQLVGSSDLIVVGSFQRQAVDSSGDATYVSGTVTVDEVLWGDMLSFLIGEVVGSEQIPVSWQVEPVGLNPVDGTTAGGQAGVWLLMETDTGTYRADGPRYLPRWKRLLVVHSLQQNRVIVRQTPLSPYSRVMVDLMVRNARQADAVVPDFRFEAGLLRLHPAVSLAVYQAGPKGRVSGAPLAPFEGRVISLDEEEWIVVASGEEHLLRLDLAELFNLDRQAGYAVEFRVAGFGKSILLLPAAVR